MEQDLSAIYAQLQKGDFDFLDLGCGTGASGRFVKKAFSAKRGLGIDKSMDRVLEAGKNGFDAIFGDVCNLSFPDSCVSFTSMMDFVEHLSCGKKAVKVLKRAAKASRDFLFVRHPNFEDIEYLKSYKLKLDWTDWHGHTNMMCIADFKEIFSALGWPQHTIIPQIQILDSTHSSILPLDAPRGAVRYDGEKQGEKPLVYFDRPVYTQFDIFVRLNPDMDEKRWQEIINKLRVNHKLEEVENQLRAKRRK